MTTLQTTYYKIAGFGDGISPNHPQDFGELSRAAALEDATGCNIGT